MNPFPMEAAAGPKPGTRSKRRAIVIAAVAGVTAGLAAWGALEVTVIRPLRQDGDRVETGLRAVRDEIGRTEAMIANYEAYRAEAESVESEYAEALSAVPSEAELAAALADVERVTGASGIRLVAFEPAKAAPKPAATASPNGGTAAPLPPAVQARPVAVILHSRYEPTQSLFDRLARYPRLLTVESFTLRSIGTGTFTTEAALTLNCYYKVAPPELSETVRGANGAHGPLAGRN